MSDRKETNNVEEKFLEKARNISERFKDFTSGVRVLFLIQRHSDGGHTNNSKLRSYITRNTDEWILALGKLMQEKSQYDIPMRVYQSLNERDIEKGIRKFKEMSLEADYYDTNQRHWFYLDVRNRIVSALMRPNVAKTSMFLIDCDTGRGEVPVSIIEQLQGINGGVFIDQYPSKNGAHVITKPFNPALLKLPENCELKKDAMMLLDY